ncbi:hypothetical protein [Coleofasciculus sp. FACHB-SPT36]|uniref:hypothetical protein n=1 Tax=Cyanophyceae TaxID=3028117 RepID=UPI00168A8B02|nr:hypothetical protein [Coleofasciculus sp. FACHB-SPT36]MBD2538415.1 hypothetical protein [Coleofasciculus sp. FACHB-SPT36]
MEPLVDRIVKKLHHLSQSKLHYVLNFIKFLSWQEERSNQLDVGEFIAGIYGSTFENIADQLADELARSVGTNVPLLFDYAVSRVGIYEEHP